MDSTSKMLEKIFAAQVVIYGKLVKMEKKMTGVSMSRPLSSDLKELEREVEKVLNR